MVERHATDSVMYLGASLNRRIESLASLPSAKATARVVDLWLGNSTIESEVA